MLQTAVEAAHKAGRLIADRYPALHTIKVKGYRDIATEVDTAAEAIVMDVIRSRFPDHDILSEEAGGNGIGPGYFLTEMTQALKDDPEFDAWLCNRTPAGRWGDLSELVGPALFLAGDGSSFVNGQVLYVDGGVLAAL